MEIFSSVAMVIVENSFVCSTDESVCCNGIVVVDSTTVEVETTDVSANNSAVPVLKIFIVVALFDVGCDEDNRECSVELERILVVIVPISVKKVALV